jgi:anti-anti-sigma factor
VSLQDLHAVVTADQRDGLVIAPHGELDLASAPQLSEWLQSALEAGNTRIVVDLGSVTFMDSAALTVLIRGHRDAGATGAALVLRGVTRRQDDLLRLTGLDTVFSVER